MAYHDVRERCARRTGGGHRSEPRRLAAEPLREGDNLRIRLCAELLTEQRLVHARVTQRSGAVTRPLERGHQTKRDPTGIWIERCQPAPCRDCLEHIGV